MLLFASLIMAVCSGAPAVEGAFLEARPIWPAGRETEMNVFAGFRAVVELPDKAELTVCVTASTLYRLFINGDFVGHGPARGPHGYYRVDEWTIDRGLHPGKNIIAIEAAGYNANSYYVLDQPSFLQAEILSGGKVYAATGVESHPFEGTALPQRVQKVQRYSFQRPFVEVYRFAPEWDAWRSDPEIKLEAASLMRTEPKKLLARGIAYPRFEIQPVLNHVASGSGAQEAPKQRFRDRSLVNISPKLKGYPKEELDITLSEIIEEYKTTQMTSVNTPLASETELSLPSGAFHIVDLGANLSGFLLLKAHCASPVRLMVSFDETLTEGDVNWQRLGCVNALLFELEPGSYVLEGFEPHTMRYIKIMALSGECVVSGIGLRKYEHPEAVKAVFQCSNDSLNRIFEAGRSTFAQNAVDIFMDCPHRERAGWLCDSFFTARSERALSGQGWVERNFIENFLLPEKFECLPEGMLPMCYPADHYDGVFIPNWALWFVLQLHEYSKRSNDPTLIASFQPRIEHLFNYFSRFENSDGLLEKLESWVFVEWSAANNFVQDVNYPSNMLYAAALDAAGELYDLQPWRVKASSLRSTIRQQALKDIFYIDNAMREGHALVPTDNRSEVCQYFAFYFGVATPEKDPELWRILLDEFGPDRMDKGRYPQVHPANAFVGNMIRFELLSQAGRADQLLREVEAYLLYMVERTGTLWENIQDHASLNHGFASHIVVTLFRDILGAWKIDAVQKTLHLRLTDIALPWCSGTIPVGDENIVVQWKRDEKSIRLYYALPTGYRVSVENMTDKTLEMMETPLF